MITISQVLTIDAAVFDTLFNASYGKMEQGTMPWEALGTLTTLEEKKQALLDVFADFCNWPSTKVLLWHKDGIPIHMGAGSIDLEDPSYITWKWALVGPDANNSKSWLYDVAYLEQKKEYFKSTLGVIGYKIECVKDGSLYNYHMNKPNAADFREISEEISEDGKLSIITATYKS